MNEPLPLYIQIIQKHTEAIARHEQLMIEQNSKLVGLWISFDALYRSFKESSGKSFPDIDEMLRDLFEEK